MFSSRRRKESSKISLENLKKAKGIFNYLKPYKIRFSIGWIFLVLSSSAGLFFPYLMGQLLGSGGEKMDMETGIGMLTLTNINSIALALLFLFILQSLFSFMRVVLFTQVTECALRDLRVDAFERLIHQPMSFFNENTVGELTSRISSDISQVQETLRTTIAEFFRQIVIIIGSICFIFFFSWKLALIMLGTVPVMAIVAVFFGRYIKKLSKQAQDMTAESTGVLEASLTGIANIKAFTNEFFMLTKFSKSVEKIKNLNIKSGWWRGAFVSFIIFCLFGAIVFIVWQGLLMTQGPNPELSRANFFSFVMFTVMMGMSVGSIPDLYASIQKAVGATENLMEIIQKHNESDLHARQQTPEFSGKIAFRNVNFSYPQRSDIKVLKGVNFDINPGQTVALVGESGGGKSTIASLLFQYYDLNEGQILFDEHDASTVHLKNLRSQIGIVPQEVILFAGTIEENIGFGKPGATQEEIIAAAKKANAHEFIQSFPDQYDTQVGDRGIQLSGGQKQRIAIARAVLKNPTILVLDEATSALDSASEKLVQDALNELMVGRTCLVIAHRMSTIKNADLILHIEKGEISAQGTHAELIDQNGTYAVLAKYQGLE